MLDIHYITYTHYILCNTYTTYYIYITYRYTLCQIYMLYIHDITHIHYILYNICTIYYIYIICFIYIMYWVGFLVASNRNWPWLSYG